jgi:glycosyltransferase involved in cell wall biosynthesis
MSKPKVVFICDVSGWAWDLKSQQLKKYLSNDFDIDIECVHNKPFDISPTKYDVYFTYGYSFIKRLVKAGVPYKKRITGLTAHRDKSILQPRMKEAYATHANSKLLLKFLKTMHNNTYYLPNGVDEEMFHPIKPIPKYRDNIVIGHIAKENPLKGHNDYIKPAIEKAGADHFYHHVNHLNKVPHEQMVPMYQEFDCFIVASIEDGTPNPALEAAACGRPIISNPIGNMPEFIKDGYNGFLLPDRNVDDYVRKIIWMRDHRDKMIEMGNNARKTVEEKWTWKVMSENYRKIIWDVVKS